jgi:hypothetical protein
LQSFPIFRAASRELRGHADITLAELASLARKFVDEARAAAASRSAFCELAPPIHDGL